MRTRAKSSRIGTRLVAAVGVIFACILVPEIASSSGMGQPSSPPRGLTSYGGEVWELDALLHDTFGKEVVNLASTRSTTNNFVTGFVPIAAGGQYTYTFADASHSTFRIVRSTRPPKTFPDVSYGPIHPFRVHGAYISCGNGAWLYREWVSGSANAWIACLAPPSATPVRIEARSSSAPVSGLTAYGHDLWEFEALLHDTFGNRPVYERGGPPETAGFTTRPATTTQGRKVTYTYTFANASHSTFKLIRPTRPPQANIGGNASSYPITVDGVYISCSHGRWLDEPDGDPNINDFVSCE
jgi:hypothetical protein